VLLKHKKRAELIIDWKFLLGETTDTLTQKTATKLNVTKQRIVTLETTRSLTHKTNAERPN